MPSSPKSNKKKDFILRDATVKSQGVLRNIVSAIKVEWHARTCASVMAARIAKIDSPKKKLHLLWKGNQKMSRWNVFLQSRTKVKRAKASIALSSQ